MRRFLTMVVLLGVLGVLNVQAAESLTPTTTVLTIPATVQYSDLFVMTATVTPAGITGVVTFTIDGVVTGGVSINASGVATQQVSILHPVGFHTVQAQFSPTTVGYDGSSDQQSTQVLAEDALASYAGVLTAKVSPFWRGQAKVTLLTTITETRIGPDDRQGDVRTARVTFIDRATGLPFTGCSNLSPAGNLNSAGASCQVLLSPGTYHIGTVVGGNYYRDNPGDDVTLVVKP